MRIATWGLEEGDEVKVYFPTGTRYLVHKITQAPREIKMLGVLVITLDNGTFAKFDEKEQRWVYTILHGGL